MVKRAWQIATAIAAAWTIAYIWFWYLESGCFDAFTMACANAPFEPIRAFVMLDWVFGYQTLLAGILATLAGAFVFWTARFQRQVALNDRKMDARRERLRERSQRRAQLIAILTTINAEVVRLYQWVMTENKPGMSKTIEAIERQIPLIAPHSSLLVTYLSAMTREVSDQLGLWRAPPVIDPDAPIIPYKNAVTALGHLLVCRAYLSDFERLITIDGTFSHSRAKFSKHDLKLIENSQELSIHDVYFADILIDLTDVPRRE